jgi:hypothetical protein
MGNEHKPKEEKTPDHQRVAPQNLRKPTRPLLRRKLMVGSAHDPAEEEADLVAEQVLEALNHGDATARRSPAAGTAPRIRRAVATPGIGLEGGAVDQKFESQLSSARGSGRPLDEGTRSSMESAFGADFSGVRIHDGSQSADLNRQVSAKAFTLGSDIFFNGKAPSGSSKEGQHLLAHELTHTLQQGGGARLSRNMRRSPFVADGPRWSSRLLDA